MKMNMVLVGFLIMLVCQDLVAVKAFKKSMREGIRCVAIPGYLLIYGTRKEPGHAKPLIGWLAGMALFLAGVM